MRSNAIVKSLRSSSCDVESEPSVIASKRDVQTVEANGAPLSLLPDGMRIRDLPFHTDERGSVFEMFDPRWEWHPDPVKFVYCFTVRPGVVKGWGLHIQHVDRYILLQGEMELVLYDVRPESSTYKQIIKVYLSESSRKIVNVPRNVWHADRALGNKDAVIVNLPTIPYDHTNPDKYRLPLDTDLIPYSFGPVVGW